MKWKEQLNGDCPRRDSRLRDRCDLVCPDLFVMIPLDSLRGPQHA